MASFHFCNVNMKSLVFSIGIAFLIGLNFITAYTGTCSKYDSNM